jgi:hypothetical protein
MPPKKQVSLADLNTKLTSAEKPQKPVSTEDWRKFDDEFSRLHAVSTEIKKLQEEEDGLKSEVRAFVVKNGKKEKESLGLNQDAKLLRSGWLIHNQAAVRRTRDEDLILAYCSKNAPQAVKEVRRFEVDWDVYESLKATNQIPAEMLAKFELAKVTYRLMKRNVGKSVCGKPTEDGAICQQEVNTSDKFCRACGAKVTQEQAKIAAKVEAEIQKAEKAAEKDLEVLTGTPSRIMATLDD